MIQNNPKVWEQLIIASILFMFIGGLPFSLFLYEEGLSMQASDSTSTVRYFWIPVYLLTVVLAVPYSKKLWQAFLSNPLLLCLVILSIVSTVWSISSEDTLRRSFSLTMTTLFGVYLALRLSMNRILLLLGWGLVVTIILSWGFALGFPSFGVMPYEGENAWRGVFLHKNSLGLTMLVALTVFFSLSLSARVRWGWWLISLFAIGLLILSKSMTSLLTGVGLFILFLLLRMLREKRFFAIAGFVISVMWVGLIAALIWGNIEFVLGTIGRDQSFTGRDIIWSLVWEKIKESFWIGYGYQVFWIVEYGPVGDVWKGLGGYQAPTAHNGFLDLWLGLGVIGVAIFVTSFLSNFYITFSRLRQERSESGFWIPLYLCLFLIVNLTESHILIQNDLLWVLYVVSVVSQDRLKISHANSKN